MTKIQVFANPAIHATLAKKLKSDFKDCEISTGDEEFLLDQDFYLISISSFLKEIYLYGKTINLHSKPFKNKVAMLKSSDLEWEKDYPDVPIIHKSNYLRIKEIVSDCALDDRVNSDSII